MHDDVPALAHPLTRPDPSPTSLIAVREIQPRISGKPALFETDPQAGPRRMVRDRRLCPYAGGQRRPQQRRS
jgi:hypothetical protein